MRIFDVTTNEITIDNIPLLTGDYPAGNLLKQYQYLQLGSIYIINASGVAMDHPDDTNLGTDFVLVWGDSE